MARVQVYGFQRGNKSVAGELNIAIQGKGEKDDFTLLQSNFFKAVEETESS